MIGILASISFVSDGDAETAVLFQDVVFEQAVAHTPAQEQPVGPVAPRNTPADGGALGAAAGVQAEMAIVFAGAIQHGDIVRLLKADPIAVVVADGAALGDRTRMLAHLDGVVYIGGVQKLP